MLTGLDSLAPSMGIDMASASAPAPYSVDAYEIRPAKNYDETRQLWWPFMQSEGWVRALCACYIGTSLSG